MVGGHFTLRAQEITQRAILGRMNVVIMKYPPLDAHPEDKWATCKAGISGKCEAGGMQGACHSRPAAPARALTGQQKYLRPQGKNDMVFEV